MDYRNAIKWYQYDPTKWFIYGCQKLGLASHLKVNTPVLRHHVMDIFGTCHLRFFE